jgi:hypothetical protein
MDQHPQHPALALRRADVPVGPGVYAWYREGKRMYVGKAMSLVDRAWAAHLGQSRSLGRSAFRRNVAEYLGFGTADGIKKKLVRLTDEERAAVRAWIEGCALAWIDCGSVEAAEDLERRMKQEFLPPLTKR